jgi:dienelactone hydrolase
MPRGDLRQWLRERLDLPELVAPAVDFREATLREGYVEHRIAYPSRAGDEIPAFLLVPDAAGPHPAVVAHHQHASQWHLGKSEVAGRAGHRLQAFGPALARRGVVVLAPDAICFEDRRRGAAGTVPLPGDGDRQAHVAQMNALLLAGGLLMTNVLADAASAVSLLAASEHVDGGRIGSIGHSFGGNTTLFHAAVDLRVAFACASGSACTYRRRLASGTGIEISQLIPGITQRLDIEDVVALIAPRPVLLVSSTDDPYSEDATEIAAAAAIDYDALGAGGRLEHRRFDGGHALTAERFDVIVEWVTAIAGGEPRAASRH